MKQYEKPRLDKRAILPAVTALSNSSGAVSQPPDNNGNEDGNDEGGGIS